MLSQETGFAGAGEPSDDDDRRRRRKTTTIHANYNPTLVTLSNLRSYQPHENSLVLASNLLYNFVQFDYSTTCDGEVGVGLGVTIGPLSITAGHSRGRATLFAQRAADRP